MTEMVKNAWLGWQRYMGGGKLAAVFLLALVLLWLKNRWKKQELLLTFSAVMAILCIFPPTAVLMMLYQTKFYDYEWIWNVVPVLAVSAYGIAEILPAYLEKANRKKRYGAALLAAALFILICCGNMGVGEWTVKDIRSERAQVVDVMGQLRLADEPVVLWAPKNVIEYARETDSSVKLFYGRNMWQKSLNAYSYDTYSEDAESCFAVMEELERIGFLLPGMENDGLKAFSAAKAAGVNRILLPANMDLDFLVKIESITGVSAITLDNGMYLMILE